jgi:MYXO-CTERM domain-containing protein
MTSRLNLNDSRPIRWLSGALVALPLLIALPAQAKVLTEADGPGGMATYDILGQHFTIETPDCGHNVPHVTEVFDDDLKKNVFAFHLHVKAALDDDRCQAKDRQRTEVRGKGPDVVANEGDTVYYRWKFKLPTGFQTSPNFCHIMQIKSNNAAPIMTLSPRETIIQMDGRLGKHGMTELAPFINTWMLATMKVLHSHNGTVELTIRRVSDGAMTFHYAGGGDIWDANTPQDPKWGLYRSLDSVADLRDEEIRFADFCISKTSAADCEDDSVPNSDASVISPPPSADGGAATDAAENPPPPVSTPDASAPPPGTPPATGGSGAGIPPVGGAGGSEPTPTGGSGPIVPPMRGKGNGGCSCNVGASGHPGGGALAGFLLLGAVALYSRRRR